MKGIMLLFLCTLLWEGESLSVGEAVRSRVEGIAKSKSQQWFEECVESVEPSGQDKIESWRAAGRSVLEGVGAPGGRAEAWRYSHDLSSIWRSRAALVEEASKQPLIDETHVPENALLVIDGVVTKIPDGLQGAEDIYFGSVAEAPEWALEMVEEDFSSVAELEHEVQRPNDALGSASWAGLNAACLRDAIILTLKEKASFTVHMIHIHSSAAAVFPRLAVALKPTAHLVLHQTNYIDSELKNEDELSGVCNSRTTIRVPAEAKMSHVYSVLPSDNSAVKTHHHESSYVHVEGEYHGTILATARARLNADIELAQPFACARLDGLCLSEHDPIELYSSIRHEAPDAISSQDIRLVAAGKTHLIFKGRIAVPVLAQRTDAQQLCRSTLLADTANALVMPCLDIIADDVKCTHGATVADLDDEALFFLLARGIERSVAKALLVKGFCNDLLTSLVPLPSQLTAALDSRIAAIVNEKDLLDSSADRH